MGTERTEALFAGANDSPGDPSERIKAKFEVWGQEMIQKVVCMSGTSGRVYLPADWVGRQVKIIRMD